MVGYLEEKLGEILGALDKGERLLWEARAAGDWATVARYEARWIERLRQYEELYDAINGKPEEGR